MAYIEHDLPLEGLNKIAQKEGNAKKPIYQMHKWWARRLGSVFRMLILERFAEDALEAPVRLSVGWLPERHLPDKRFDLLGEVCARACIPTLSGPADLSAGLALTVRTVAAARPGLALSPALSTVEGLSKGSAERCWPGGSACRPRRCCKPKAREATEPSVLQWTPKQIREEDPYHEASALRGK